MRKTSHEGVDTTSITSGIENEVKKNSTSGIIKIKKSSIKRKVPNFSHESDDGIVEPLLQSDKEKSETTPRSAKYLLSKTKTDSISENEDSIKMSEINISNSSASTPITAANKVITTSNMKNGKDSISVSNVNEGPTLRNHMNTNVFCKPEASKAIISTKSPIIVELDAAKTTSYSPSLIFTTAKIHSDCKTKLMEPVQVTPVPIISTTEKDIEKPKSLTENTHEMNDVRNKTGGAVNNLFDELHEINKGLSKDVKADLEDIRKNITSKAILNLTEKSTSDKCEHEMPNTSLNKNALGNNILTKTDIKNANVSTDLVNDKQISKDLNPTNVGQVKNTAQLIHSKKEIIETSGNKDNDLPSSSFKTLPEKTSDEKGDKKITVQGSKKLQRQKKATVEESQDTTSFTTKGTDKLCFDEKKKTLDSQTTTTICSSTAPSITQTAKSPNAQTSHSKGNNISKSVIPPIECSKIPSQIGSLPKAIDFKLKTPVANTVTSQPLVSSKIPTQVVSMPKTSDSNIQTAVNKNLTLQPVASSKIPSQEATISELPDSEIQTPVSKIPSPATPVSNSKSTQGSASKLAQGTSAIKIPTSNKKGENLDAINKNGSLYATKSGVMENLPVVTEKSSLVPKTLPPYIVSTSKTKIGAPMVTSATLKSEANKSISNSKSPMNSYLVKTTPATNLKTVTASMATSVATSKSDAHKTTRGAKSSTIYSSKDTPATSLKSTTTSVPASGATSASLKTEASKLTSDSKSSTGTYLVKDTLATSLKTAITCEPTSVAKCDTSKSDAKKSTSDSKTSINTHSLKETSANSIITATTSVSTTTSSSSQSTKQSIPVKQSKSNTDKQKGGSKA